MAGRRSMTTARRRSRPKAPQQLSLLDLIEAPDSRDAESSKPAKKTRVRRPAKAAVERPVVFTPAEAALYLNLKPATLKSWRAKGTGPVFVKRAARLVGYTQAALDAWLAGDRRSTP